MAAGSNDPSDSNSLPRYVCVNGPQAKASVGIKIKDTVHSKVIILIATPL